MYHSFAISGEKDAAHPTIQSVAAVLSQKRHPTDAQYYPSSPMPEFGHLGGTPQPPHHTLFCQFRQDNIVDRRFFMLRFPPNPPYTTGVTLSTPL
ncbi:MAG: hypothetical protein KME26_25435 [Oscillatoria princeps RMCB-10]|jgi:hypothetical protein|nr:hypothetical protein [Oscillatoria princeps RMCB-10]